MTPREAIARSLEASRLCAQPWESLPKSVRDAELHRADAILAALRDAGFAVVPRKPTAAMLGKVRVNGGDTSVAYALAVWPDMLAAAEGETR